MTTFGILIFEGAGELDFIGPWEVFAASAVIRAAEITVVRDARSVVDGNLVTSQGVSAGTDMALWLVGRIHGRPHARAVRRKIQYEPSPPYMADEPLAW